MKILMVCLGNICRSPLAEGILQNLADEKGLNWQVESAGTGSWHVDEKPDKRSIEVARQNGIDISHQRAQQFSPYHLEQFDLIYAMDQSNLRDILNHAKDSTERDKIEMIMNMADPGMNEAVPDPYYGDEGFDRVFKMLEKACKAIVDTYA
jgi:protein-tyrosine phosphatase